MSDDYLSAPTNTASLIDNYIKIQDHVMYYILIIAVEPVTIQGVYVRGPNLRNL